MKEKYWISLCELANEYREESENQEECPPNYHYFEPSGIGIIVFKGTESDCEEIIERLKQRSQNVEVDPFW